MPKRHLSISHTFSLSMILILIVSTLVPGYLWIRSELKKHHRDTVAMKAEYISLQRSKLKREVQQVIDFILYKRSQTEGRLKADIKNRVYEAHAIASRLYELNKDSLSSNALKRVVAEALRPIRFKKGRGYYFATDLKGVVWLFTDRPELEGKDIRGMRDTQEKPVALDMIRIAKEHQEGFYQYHWTKPNVLGKDYPKIAYIKYFEPFDWYIGTGEYLDDVDKDIQQEVLARIEKIRFGKDGYIFAGTWAGLSLSGPAKGQNMYDIEDIDGVKIVQELIKASQTGGGFVTYVIPKFEADNKTCRTFKY